MIIVNLKGGLGNQMFQYACGRALSLRHNNRPLKLDTFGLERANKVGDIYRPYTLSHFNIQENLATEMEIKMLKYPFGIFSKIRRYTRAKVLRKFYTEFIPDVLHWSGDIYLDGFWQSEKYFKDVESVIRTDFTLRTPLLEDAKEVKTKIVNASCPVSIHVRRGDYVNSPMHDTQNISYYDEAVRRMLELFPHSHFFVFSDDISWVQKNISFPTEATFVSFFLLKDYEELFLMSLCHHHIIANSTFSWWGAWLNESREKVVFAPKKWVNGPANYKKFKDIIPESWIRI